MGEWVLGAVINIIGSVTINFGTNLLKLGHEQRSALYNGELEGKRLKPIVFFRSWRVGILFFALGNCLNFISFAYAAQSLLAALGSIQFISNVAFAYLVLKKTVRVKIMVATTFVVFGNIFLVSFGNHQSAVYTAEELIAKYNNLVFILYCLSLLLIVVLNHIIYRKGGAIVSSGKDIGPHWWTLRPFSYAVVSGSVGSFSVLFAKSLSNMLRLTIGGNYQLWTWFTYLIFLLFLITAGFWMIRLNEGLSMFDAILIVPMFQIVWTFFSICTGFVYFQEYQVFNTLRITMFLIGIGFVFVGILLLAPDESKARDVKDSLEMRRAFTTDENRFIKIGSEAEDEVDGLKSSSALNSLTAKVKSMLVTAKREVNRGIFRTLNSYGLIKDDTLQMINV